MHPKILTKRARETLKRTSLEIQLCNHQLRPSWTEIPVTRRQVSNIQLAGGRARALLKCAAKCVHDLLEVCAGHQTQTKSLHRKKELSLSYTDNNKASNASVEMKRFARHICAMLPCLGTIGSARNTPLKRLAAWTDGDPVHRTVCRHPFSSLGSFEVSIRLSLAIACQVL